MDIQLSQIEGRVLACLIEKELTTPEYYPLTLNALTAACNQKSNRDPVMQIDDSAVASALDSLRDRRMAWEMTSTSTRVPKYKHSLPAVIPLSPQQLAILCELLLRGPQTAAELRLHASRLAPFSDVGQVQTALGDLMGRPDGPLLVRLPRQTGQREERYGHLLCGPVTAPGPEAGLSDSGAQAGPAGDRERMAALEAAVASLRDELDKLKAQFEDFAKQFQ